MYPLIKLPLCCCISLRTCKWAIKIWAGPRFTCARLLKVCEHAVVYAGALRLSVWEIVPRAFTGTGGLGFIGSNFIRLVLRERPESRIVNLDAMTYAGNPANCAEFEGDRRYRFVKGDICDPATVEEPWPTASMRS